MQRNTIDLVLLDLRLPKISGLDLLTQIRKIDQDVPIVMLTAYGDVQTAVEAMKLGACYYLLKGFDLEELLMVVQRSLETSAMSRELRELRRERRDNYHFNYIIGHSERMREIFEIVARVARNDASILIIGESGNGKKIVTHAHHKQRARAKGPFT